MSGINDQWQADLVDVSSLASSNDKHTFILTVIDGFSKVGYAQPLRNKEARSITNAFKTILYGLLRTVSTTNCVTRTW